LIVARVLLIDDDQSNLEFMRQVMRIDGHELAWAPDGKQGLEQAGQFHPQLVICDVVMPHLGGYAVLETLRAEPRFADVPVLLFSAAMNDEARALGLKRGATEVLSKPFNLEQLRGAIKRCLGQES
jgi:DNA-binding response OmpR family regulator